MTADWSISRVVVLCYYEYYSQLSLYPAHDRAQIFYKNKILFLQKNWKFCQNFENFCKGNNNTAFKNNETLLYFYYNSYGFKKFFYETKSTKRENKNYYFFFREHPSTIKKRFFSCFVMTLISPASLYFGLSEKVFQSVIRELIN